LGKGGLDPPNRRGIGLGRPSKALISRDRAARAALDVIDIQGLENFSLDLVARRLGVKAPSLYHHFHDKDELLAEVALCILREIEAPFVDPNRWDETIVGLCKEARRTILRHPNAAPLLLKFFPRHIFLRGYNYWIEHSPYPPELQLIVLEGTEKLTFGSALFAAAARASSVAPMPEFNAEELPQLARAVRASSFDDESLFVETLRTFLAGMRAVAAAKAAKAKITPKAKPARRKAPR
jgi:AcrR family transcriptional regulator